MARGRHAAGVALRTRILPSLLVVLLVCAGPAEASRVSGYATFPEGLRLHGVLDVTAHGGALDLAPAATPRWPLVVSWTAAHGAALTSTRDYVGGSVFVGESHANSTFRWGAGSLQNLSCAPGCRVLLFARPGGTLRASGEVDGPLLPVGQAHSYWTGWRMKDARDSFSYDVGSAWLNVSLGDSAGTRLRDGVAAGEGLLGLLLWGVEGDVQHETRSERVVTGTTESPLTGPGGVETGTRSERRAILLYLDGASFTSPPEAPVSLFAPRADLVLDGVLDAKAAVGRLDVEDRHVRLDGGPLRLDGVVALAPAFHSPDRFPFQESPTPVETPVEGNAEVQVGHARVAALPSAAERAAWTAAAVALAAGVLAAAKAGALTGLYTRLVRSTILRNPNRQRVLSEVAQRPGVHVRELARLTGVPEGVVRHHLRVLMRHAFVTQREEGKMRTYFPAGTGLDEVAQEAILALKDPTRRRVAQEVAAAASPLSQVEIALRLGLSPRLVSHHLGRLEEAELVVSRGSLPRRYAPAPRLRDAVGAQPAG